MQSALSLKRCWLTWLIGVSVCLAYLFPGWREAFIYDRTAIQEGEVWRLWTGHLVHFTWQHLCLDVLVFSLSSIIVEQLLGRRGRVLILMAAGGISLGLYAFAPALQRFGGLSGVAVFTATLATLSLIRALPGWRIAGWVLLSLICLKVVLENYLPTGGLEFADLSSVMVMKEPLSHAIGLLLALLSGVWPKVVSGNRPIQTATIA